MDAQTKLKIALGEFVLNQIQLSDQIERQQARINELETRFADQLAADKQESK